MGKNSKSTEQNIRCGRIDSIFSTFVLFFKRKQAKSGSNSISKSKNKTFLIWKWGKPQNHTISSGCRRNPRK
jgi:hypothetical protein